MKLFASIQFLSNNFFSDLKTSQIKMVNCESRSGTIRKGVASRVIRKGLYYILGNFFTKSSAGSFLNTGFEPTGKN
jgi:hypothetical protein